MRILWVENHPRFVSIARQQFLAGHELTVVPSLTTARAVIAAHHHFDAALVDYDLDDGKGDALVGELRQLFPRMLIVATSSHDDGNRALCAAGANEVCGKLEFGRITKLLDSWIDREPQSGS